MVVLVTSEKLNVFFSFFRLISLLAVHDTPPGLLIFPLRCTIWYILTSFILGCVDIRLSGGRSASAQCALTCWWLLHAEDTRFIRAESWIKSYSFLFLLIFLPPFAENRFRPFCMAHVLSVFSHFSWNTKSRWSWVFIHGC